MALAGGRLVTAARNRVGNANQVGTCQLTMRSIAGLPSAGDFDGDGDADAVDAWRRCRSKGEVVETSNADRIPAGTFVYWSGGRNGYGHVAITLGDGRCVSTDWPSGRIGVAKIDDITRTWNLRLLGYVVVYFDGHVFLPHETRAAKREAARVAAERAKRFTPGRYRFEKSSIQTFRTLNSTEPMRERTRGPVVRTIRQIRVNKYGQVRGRVRPLVGRWYRLDGGRATRLTK